MRPLSLTFGASLLPSFSLVAAAGKDCYGKVCHPVNEYCSTFTESCDLCEKICNNIENNQNYNQNMCAKECADYNKYDALKAEIQSIEHRQRIILILLIILLGLIAIRYTCKLVRWLHHKRCLILMLKKMQPKSMPAASAGATTTTAQNGKDLNATTIQNLNAINTDIERAPSQIYSITGAAEGSVLTMTTPISTRHPAENSTTPTTIGAEYSYDNQGLVVTPVSDKPGSGNRATAGF